MKKLLLILLALAGSSFGQGFTVTGLITKSGSTCTSATMNATLNGPSNCVSMQLAANISQASIVLAGTFSATVQFELSADNGATWVAAPTASSTSAGTSNFQVAAYTHLRARASTYSSGAVTVTITLSTAAISSSGGSGTATAIGTAANPVATTAAATVGQYEAWNPGGTSFDLLGQPTFDVAAYGGVPDGSTANATAIAAAFTASNAMSLGIPVVHFGCVPGVGCQYNVDSGASVSPINPTIPTTIKCDPGVTINFTGTSSAHLLDIGPTGLGSTTYHNQPYKIEGCRFTGGATASQGVWVNPYLIYVDITDNTFYNFGPSASTGYMLNFQGYNWRIDVAHNTVRVDDTTKRNVLHMEAPDANSRMDFVDNNVTCVNGAHGTTGCTVAQAGIGIELNGFACVIEAGKIEFFQPNIWLRGSSSNSSIMAPYLEIPPSTSPAGAIMYGETGGVSIDGIRLIGGYANLQSQSSAYLMYYKDASDVLTHLNIYYPTITNAPAQALLHTAATSNSGHVTWIGNSTAPDTNGSFTGMDPFVLGAHPTSFISDAGNGGIVMNVLGYKAAQFALSSENLKSDDCRTWASGSDATATLDTGFCRSGAGTAVFGNGSAGDTSGVLSLSNVKIISAGSTGKGACIKSDKSIGYCSTVVGADGSCTCN